MYLQLSVLIILLFCTELCLYSFNFFNATLSTLLRKYAVLYTIQHLNDQFNDSLIFYDLVYDFIHVKYNETTPTSVLTTLDIGG